MLIGPLCTSRHWPQCQQAVVAMKEAAHNPLFNKRSPNSKEVNKVDVVPPVFLRSRALTINDW
jgi:hypothetical protein